MFFGDLYFVKFCDEINFEKLKLSPRKHQQGVNLQDSYSIPMKKSSKIMNMRNILKNLPFSVLLPIWRGVTKLDGIL
jgi:hypothetical protein